jgi:hypothetical protein
VPIDQYATQVSGFQSWQRVARKRSTNAIVRRAPERANTVDKFDRKGAADVLSATSLVAKETLYF